MTRAESDLPPIVDTWRRQAGFYGRRGGRAKLPREKECRGISFQFPPGWDDGSGKVRHVKDGIWKGRVCWTSRREAQDIASRLQDKAESRVRYDPD